MFHFTAVCANREDDERLVFSKSRKSHVLNNYYTHNITIVCGRLTVGRGEVMIKKRYRVICSSSQRTLTTTGITIIYAVYTALSTWLKHVILRIDITKVILRSGTESIYINYNNPDVPFSVGNPLKKNFANQI
jgi:hypothetical protein